MAKELICCKCGKIIIISGGYYNSPRGAFCVNCYENEPKKAKDRDILETLLSKENICKKERTMENKKFNFRKEYNALPACNQKRAKLEIMEALGIKTDMGFNYRVNGVNNTSQAEQEAIKRIIIKNRDIQITLNF